jgi:hypothetical protein
VTLTDPTVEKQAGCGWRISPDIVMEWLAMRRSGKKRRGMVQITCFAGDTSPKSLFAPRRNNLSRSERRQWSPAGVDATYPELQPLLNHANDDKFRRQCGEIIKPKEPTT